MIGNHDDVVARADRVIDQRRDRQLRARLRDEFAGMAMQSMLSMVKPVANFTDVAEAAYAQADAMIAARGGA